MKKLVSFFEIPATDFVRAVNFYECVFNVSLSVYECETEKMACFPEEDGFTPGSISYAEDFKPGKDGVLVSLYTDDLDKALIQIKYKGGKILRDKTKIEVEGRGYFALFIDSEGNRVGLYSDK